VLNLNLADDARGWLGSGMDDIYDQRIPMTASPIRLNKGVNEITVQHTMREDPLENILSTGIRVEKVKP
jgi:gliding motility-associated lipoprotein GldH